MVTAHDVAPGVYTVIDLTGNKTLGTADTSKQSGTEP